jgi:hypothetical protein
MKHLLFEVVAIIHADNIFGMSIAISDTATPPINPFGIIQLHVVIAIAILVIKNLYKIFIVYTLLFNE